VNVRRVIPRDAIPSVDDPSFGDTYGGDDDDLVIVVEHADGARSYPVPYLQYHEIVNDVVDNDGTPHPVAVTWCPLCGSAVVYDRVHHGRTLEFGVSGKLADDDLVMYDRETESEWKQSSGECLSGPYAGDSLSVRPGTMVTWQTFRESFPEGVVLQPPGGESEAASDDDTPAPIDYDRSPYEDYASGEGFGLAAHQGVAVEREWRRDDGLSPKTVVLGIETDDDALGFPLPRVMAEEGVVQSAVGSRDVVVFATDTAGIHGFVDPGFTFKSSESAVLGDGTTWNPATGRAADGRQLERFPTRRLYAFAWQDDHGPDSFYGLD